MEHGKDGNRMKDSEEQEQQLISLFHQLIDASMPRLALYLAALALPERGSSFSRLHIPKTLLTHTHTHTPIFPPDLVVHFTGACYKQNGQTNSLGKLNSHLRFNQSGSPYLLYEDGGHCGTGERRWSTKIEFVCANNATKDNGNTSGSSGGTSATNTVKIIEDSNCQLLIQYQTPYACQEQIKCTDKGYAELSGDFTIDLTPLINANENYEASIDLPAKQAEKLPKNTKVSDKYRVHSSTLPSSLCCLNLTAFVFCSSF